MEKLQLLVHVVLAGGGGLMQLKVEGTYLTAEGSLEEDSSCVRLICILCV